MKIKLGVFFGGKSVEHEISIISMIEATLRLDEEKYEIVPIYIAKTGEMYTGEDLLDLEMYRDMDVLLKRCYKVAVIRDGKKINVVRVPAPLIGKSILNTIDVAFPIVHGTNCEDGSVAGFLNLLDIPYVGPDILASSVGMDKIVMKKVLKESGLPVVDYIGFYSKEYIKDEDKILNEINEKLKYPLIVKPGNLGSSVGIKKVKDKVELEEAILFAMEFADRIIVENCVSKLKEINCAVIGNITESTATECEEPILAGEILSYTDKYVGDRKTKGGKLGKVGPRKGGKLGARKGGTGGVNNSTEGKKLPADIPNDVRDEIQNLAKETFKVLGCSGISRIDFLIDEEINKIYVNEINTIPGALSWYLFEASGRKFEDVLEEAINIAIKRHSDREKITFSYDQNILALTGGVKRN
ncbi:MAG: D-alanine--D-alanine ligase [Clostridia bacterium]|nr:D-alanine--D-alanine ligase [Clostridia bacterium]